MNRRWLSRVSPILQATATVTVAWVVAFLIHGDENPFFAPIAAAVSFSAPRGERGLQAVRLMTGVVLGILVGEGTVAMFGSPVGRLAAMTIAELTIATFIAMLIAHLLGATRVVVTQAASGAILTVAAADGVAGLGRVIDALIGGGVALFFSQGVFSPEPVALLRRAEDAVLPGVVRGLRMIADALERDDEALGERAVESLRVLRGALMELARLRQASMRTARRSALWRAQRVPLQLEQQQADYLDRIAGGSVMLARAVLGARTDGGAGRPQLASRIRELAAVLDGLSRYRRDPANRRRTVERALEVARPLSLADGALDPATVVALGVLRILATDAIVFAGVPPQRAADAVREGLGTYELPPLPATPRIPFGLDRRRESTRSTGEVADRPTDAADRRDEE